VLRLALLGVGAFVAYLLTVTALRPVWLGLVNGWLLVALAWPEFLGLLLLTWWLHSTHRPGVLTWSLLSVAWLCYALAQTIWLVGDQVLSPPNLAHPWWSNLLFLLQNPFTYLALLLLPSAPGHDLHGLARLRVFLDSVLLMATVALLFWYFLLVPRYLERWNSSPAKVLEFTYVLTDLGLLFILIFMVVYARRPRMQRIVLGLLLAANALIVIGDLWYAVLNQLAPSSAAPPAVFWLLGYLLVPLTGLVGFRLTRHAALLRVERSAPQPLLWRDILNCLRFLLPFLLALLASAGLLARAILAPSAGRNPVPPWVASLGLLALVLIRQGVVYLENVRLRREREESHAYERALNQTNRQLETFLGMACHELKTPLTSVLMGLQMIQRRVQHPMPTRVGEGSGTPPDGDVVHALAQTTLQQGERLNRLINDMIDISRIQAGRLELHLKREDLVSIVRRMVEEQRQTAPERSISLSLDVASLVVCADADRIGQVVTNYLTNALKYSQEDRPVEVGVQGEGQQGRVWVRDHGPGIPLAEQEHLWERFYSVPGIEVQSGSGIGLGLGLHISKTIIEYHQGQVGIQSSPRHGSTFWFTLPLAGPEQDGKE
jgi:signal transduction histidine kinase